MDYPRKMRRHLWFFHRYSTDIKRLCTHVFFICELLGKVEDEMIKRMAVIFQCASSPFSCSVVLIVFNLEDKVTFLKNKPVEGLPRRPRKWLFRFSCVEGVRFFLYLTFVMIRGKFWGNLGEIWDQSKIIFNKNLYDPLNVSLSDLIPNETN